MTEFTLEEKILGEIEGERTFRQMNLEDKDITRKEYSCAIAVLDNLKHAIREVFKEVKK